MTTNVWDFLAQPNKYAENTQQLYEWGLNCHQQNNPFLLFLDLIQWSLENYGQKFDEYESFGYLELDYLGDALKEYAENPNEVYEWVSNLMQTEGA